MNGNNSYIGSPDNPRTAAVVAYITIFGWLISYFWLYPGNKTSFSKLHLQQSLLIHLISFLLKVLYSFTLSSLTGAIIAIVLAIGLFILWLIGFIHALNGRERLVPVIGPAAQNLFRNL